jgi:AraC-like DNA-binding protein
MANSSKPSRPGASWRQLLQVARPLKFERHDIRSRLDATGRYDLALEREFPLAVSLFRFTSRHFTRGVTWHERLEVFLPLDGRVYLRMGEKTVRLDAGDLLVVENLKPHHVVDHPAFNTRVIVISFLPEFVYSLGSPSHDYTFLLPFYAPTEGREQVLRHTEAAAGPAYDALARLLQVYMAQGRQRFRESACKAWLLVLLQQLAERFHDAEVHQWEYLRQRQLSERFNPLFDRVNRNCAERLTLVQAARLAGMSKAQFTRQFKQVAGMTFVAYVTHVRLGEAARLLKMGEGTIAEIADRVGFSDQSYFDRCFKRAFGQTPRAFRGR